MALSVSDSSVGPSIDRDHCVGCGACARACPRQALWLCFAAGAPVVVPGQCDYCGLCETVCPQRAIVCPYEIVLAPASVAREGGLAGDAEDAFVIVLSGAG